MVLTKWSAEMTSKFITLYREQECLWRIDSQTYRDQDARNTALRNLITGMDLPDLTIDDVKKKIKYLRSTYMVELNKIEKSQRSGAGTSTVYKPSLIWFQDMDAFIKYVNVKRKFFVNTAYTAPPAIQDHTARNHAATVDRTPTRQTRQSVTQSTPTDPKTTAYDTDMFYAKKQMDEAVTYLKKATTEKRDMDEYDLYGQLLAKKLRKLDEHQRDVAMHEIDNIMFRAKMQSGPSQTRSYSSSPSPVPRNMKSPVFIVTQQNQVQYEDENIPYQDHMQGQPPP